jgi:protein arginine kinase activator
MECESCHSKEATVHLTQVINGEVKKVHLCEGCAKESGVTMKIPTSIHEILQGVAAPKLGLPEATKSCPACKMTRADFKKIGRLGCADCYEAFEDELAGVIKAMHQADRHQGKFPRRLTEKARVSEELDRLRGELSRAIGGEQFEQAARLRDQIRQLSGKLQGIRVKKG